MSHSKLALVFCAILAVTTVSCETKDLNMGPDVLGLVDGSTPDGSPSTPDSDASNNTDTDTDTDAGQTEPKDASIGVDGSSTWSGDAALPPVESLVANINATFRLNYFNNATAVENVPDGRAQGVTYFVQFSDALGRYLYRSTAACPFDDFHVFKPITGGESSGPVAVTDGGVADIGVVVSNPTNIQIAPLVDGDAPAGATGACRTPSTDTNYEYEGLAMLRHLTVGVRITRTAERCATYCRARGDMSPSCASTCTAVTTPFTAQATFELDRNFNIVPHGAATGSVVFDAASDNLNVNATLTLN